MTAAPKKIIHTGSNTWNRKNSEERTSFRRRGLRDGGRKPSHARISGNGLFQLQAK